MTFDPDLARAVENVRREFNGELVSGELPICFAAEWLAFLVARGGDGFLELRYRDGKGVRQEWFPTSEPLELVSRAYEVADRSDLWIGQAVRGRRRGRAEDCIRVNLVWADCDNGREALDAFAEPPNLLIASGTPGHYQAFWALEEPADLRDPDERERFQAVLRGLQRDVGSDPVHDVSRVMRLPSTLNHKGGEPVLVEPLEFRPAGVLL